MSTGSSLDLLVLKELLGRMGGCDTLLDVSSQQLEGLAGGRTLQAEVMGAQVKDNVNKKAIKILRDTMLSSGTALPLLLFIAQSRSNILYQQTSPGSASAGSSAGSSSQLKLISYLYDTCQDVLMQFTDFLLNSNSPSTSSTGSGSGNGNGNKAGGGAGAGGGAESLVEMMPSMRYLLNDIGLAIPIAFQLIRPLLRIALQYGVNPTSAPIHLQPWHPFSEEMKEIVYQYLPSDIWNAISPELYLTFWSLSLYDVFLPKLKYETEIKRLKDKYSDLDLSTSSSLAMATMNGKVSSSSSQEDRLLLKQKRNEMNKLLALTNTLKEELDAQRKHVESIRNMMIHFKKSYLTHVTSELSPKTTEYIMQHCLFARVILSPTDAIFCSQFFMLLHSLETPGFSTIHFIDKTMKTLAPLIFCSTEYEASFLGFYIHDLLEICNRWIVSKTAYNKEARAKCGMEKTFGAKGIDGRATHEEYLNVCKVSWCTCLFCDLNSLLPS
jgi:THO complex subunit 2